MKALSLLLTLLLLFPLVGCSQTGGESTPPNDTESHCISLDAFDLPDDIPTYDPSGELPYDEYFAEERYLTKPEAFGEKAVLGPRYRYLRGVDTVPEDTEGANRYNYDYTPLDNLYLYNLMDQTRTLLVGLPGLTGVIVYPDRLYLRTETALYRCGLLGEDVTLLYDHGAPFWLPTDPYMWTNEVAYFVDQPINAPDAAYWRLYLPTGQTDRIATLSALETAEQPDGFFYQPVTNMTLQFNHESLGVCFYSALTGETTPMQKQLQDLSPDELLDWARDNYPLRTK